LVNPSIDLSASTLSMLDLGIVEGEIKVGAVVLGMALSTAYRNRHEAISFCGVLGMSAARSMARFALYVGELWSRIDGLEATGLVANHVALDAALVELLVALLESRHGMRMAGILPNIIFLLVTLSAFVYTGIRRRGVEQTNRASRRLYLLDRLAL